MIGLNRFAGLVTLAALAALTLTFALVAQEETDLSEDIEAVNDFLIEFWNMGNIEQAEEFLAPDLVLHFLDSRPDREGIEGYVQFMQELRTMVPDFTVTIDKQVAQGDLVAVMWTVTGTHTGDVPDIPATGNPVLTHGMSMVRFANGKIAEWWHSEDMLTILTNLGVIPPQAETG